MHFITRVATETTLEHFKDKKRKEKIIQKLYTYLQYTNQPSCHPKTFDIDFFVNNVYLRLTLPIANKRGGKTSIIKRITRYSVLLLQIIEECKQCKKLIDTGK